MKKISIFLLSLLLLCGCTDDMSNMFSQREYVYCFFDKLQYQELNLVMDNLGQWASIRKHTVEGVTRVTMTCAASSTPYNLNAETKNFGFGLGGLIVGTTNYGEPRCYDLACPICDRADRRLTLTNDGYAKCGKCGVTFRLDDNTFTIPEGFELPRRHALYRYRIEYNGQIVNAHN